MAEKTTKKAAPKKTELSLDEQLSAVRADLLEARKSHRAGDLVNPRVLGKHRKQIARLMTQRNAEKEGK